MNEKPLTTYDSEKSCLHDQRLGRSLAHQELRKRRSRALAALLPLLRVVIIDGCANLLEDVRMVDDEILADVISELDRVLQRLERLEKLRRLILHVLRCIVALLDSCREKLQRRAQLAQAVEHALKHTRPLLICRSLDQGHLLTDEELRKRL